MRSQKAYLLVESQIALIKTLASDAVVYITHHDMGEEDTEQETACRTVPNCKRCSEARNLTITIRLLEVVQIQLLSVLHSCHTLNRRAFRRPPFMSVGGLRLSSSDET